MWLSSISEDGSESNAVCNKILSKTKHFPDCVVHVVLISHISELDSPECASESAFDNKQVCLHQLNCKKVNLINLPPKRF